MKTDTGISKVDVRPDGLINIIGDTQTAVEAARDQLEIVQYRLQVPSKSVGSLIGTKGQQVLLQFTVEYPPSNHYRLQFKYNRTSFKIKYLNRL